MVNTFRKRSLYVYKKIIAKMRAIKSENILIEKPLIERKGVTEKR